MTLLAGRRSPRPLVLAYHGVADVPLREDPYRLFVRPVEIRRHVARLRRWGYELTTYGELARRVAAGTASGLAALTFDDGLADNLHELVPLLRELDVPATVFVAPGLLGGMHPDAPAHRMLTAEELRALAGAGVEIGAHSMSHADLTTLDPASLLDDLVRCREELSALTGVPVDLLAYPFGSADPATCTAARAAGYRAACMTCGEGSWADPYRLPRQAMNNRDTTLGFWLKRHGCYEQVMAPVRWVMPRLPMGRVIGATRRLRILWERIR